MILSDLFAYLTTAPSVDADPTRAAALVSLQTLIGTRLYPDFLPEGEQLDAAVFQLISNSQDYTLDGEAIDIRPPHVQIDFYSNSAVTREQLGQFARTALEGNLGAMVGTNVGMAILKNEMNMYDPVALSFRKMLEFEFVHYTDDSESAPSAVPGIPGARKHLPVEAKNGIRTSFTFLGIPSQADQYLLVVGGLVECTGFTQVGNVITFETAPDVATDLFAYY